MTARRPLRMHLAVERWPLRHPFRITGYVMETIEVVVCTLSRGAATGRGEATGVYYRDETGDSMAAAIEAVRAEIETGATLDEVQNLLPPGGARNALDCALWELESAESGVPVWRMAGMEPPRPLLTTFTLGADTPEMMARRAAETVQASALKLKLIGDGADSERVAAVRRSRPEVWLGVDANQAFDRAGVDALLPALDAAGVKLLEQPCPIGEEETLRGLNAPMPLAADESAHTRADLDRLVGIFDVINIKLDKTGGLTEALAMARSARAMELKTMVGNMIGTSLSCAPGFLAGQLCEIVDLDGPWHLAADRDAQVVYADGAVDCPAGLWGSQ